MTTLEVDAPNLPTTEREIALVLAGREIVKRQEVDALRLGRLTLEYAPVGPNFQRTGAYARVREYAESIGADWRYLRNLRNIAWAWSETDVQEGEVPFVLLRALAPVTNKHVALEWLRYRRLDESPPTAMEAVQHARLCGWMPSSAGRGDERPGTKLRRALAALEATDLTQTTGKRRDDLAALVNEIGKQHARLVRELFGARWGGQ